MKSRSLIYIVVFLFLCCDTLVAHADRTGEHTKAFQMFIEGAPLDEALNQLGKCALPFIGEVRSNWDRMSDLQQMQFENQFGRPVTDTYVISPKGYFRIHYDTTGGHAPNPEDNGGNGIPDYIDSVAAAFDYSYEFHIHTLGYDTPEEYGTIDQQTGDTLYYDVYVRNLINIYGFTNWFGDRINDESDPVPRYRTFIVIDNSYIGFASPGIDGVKVTAAHELHHAIQIGAYGNWLVGGSDRQARFFYEITSTWLEDVVYPEINDYYYYLPVLFSVNMHRSPFYDSSGIHMYARAIWGHLMERRYSRDIMRRKWEHIREVQPMTAIDRALREHGSTLEQELAEFNLWKFYTGPRARPDRFFIDGGDYPVLAPKTPIMQHMDQSMFKDVDVKTQTLHYHGLVTDEQDTVFFLVANVENRVDDTSFYEVSVFSQQRANTIPVGNGLWYRLDSDNPSGWKVFTMFEQSPVVDRRVRMFPNPFRTGQASSVSFVIDTDEDIELSIFSNDMRLVYQDFVTTERVFDQPVIRWNGRDTRNRPVASGVYVYVLRYGDTTKQGKITLIRE